MLKRHITAFLKLLAIQHKGKSHFAFRIAVIRIDKPFADRRFLYFLFCLFGPGVSVGFAANYDQLNPIKIGGKVYFLNQWLADNIFMFDRQFIDNRKPVISPVLIFYCTANRNIIVSIVPVLWSACRSL